VFFVESLIQHFISELPRKAHILDVCCGTDSLDVIKRLIESHFQVSAIDISEKIILFFKGDRKAKNPDYQYVKKIDFIVQDARKMGFKNEIFDGLTGIYALDYFSTKEIPNLIQSFYRVLKDHALMILSFGIEAEAYSEGFNSVQYFHQVYESVINTGFTVLSVKSELEASFHWISARKLCQE
jgi:ubiquinone/menaquinone biosynthesis C-methylase UbiE